MAANASALHSNLEQTGASSHRLLPTGVVSLAGQRVRFTRPGLVEEYSVSLDGVQQDFVVREKPGSSGRKSAQNEINQSRLTSTATDEGKLRLELSVTGARVESTAQGAQLVLEHSGRKIAYSRLKVTDATGKELPARFEVTGRAGSPLPDARSGLTTAGTHGATHPTLAILVNDADATYPIRIDPTFSDANWISMGEVPGANGFVQVAVVDGSGNLYIGGSFTVVGNTTANYIAQWNGHSWSALGSGLDDIVWALAVAGSNVYAGGWFTTAGGSAANHIAQWNGHSWSALGSGMGGGSIVTSVYALVVVGSNVYAGGGFTTADGKVSGYAARAVLEDASSYNQITVSSLSGGQMQLIYVGDPSTDYALDRTFNLASPIAWTAQTTNTTSVSGVLTFTNTPVASTNNFWRVRAVP